MKLAGQVAIVTGAASGIGRAIALELACHGADIVVNDRCDISEVHTVVEQIRSSGRRAICFLGDVSARGDCQDMVQAAVKQLGTVDILVNNAARSVRKPLLELETEDVSETWNTSVWGVFHCSQFAARQMVTQRRGGSIVVISSVHAEMAFAGSSPYNAAKAAINQMARTWASELAPYNIRVNVIEPGWINTPAQQRRYSPEQLCTGGAELPLGRLGCPEDIARGVTYLASQDSGYVTGSVLRIDGGFSLPRVGVR